jgi:hypothetical protein
MINATKARSDLHRPVQEFADAHSCHNTLVRTDRGSYRWLISRCEERTMRQEKPSRSAWRWAGIVASGLLAGGILSGCHQSKTPVVTDADVAAAQAQASKEVQDARVEARKDLKNASKQAGPDSKNAQVARVTGSFDVAMASADGDHKVALEKCLVLAPADQQACRDQADAQYQAAAASAKAARVSKLSGG